MLIHTEASERRHRHTRVNHEARLRGKNNLWEEEGQEEEEVQEEEWQEKRRMVV